MTGFLCYICIQNVDVTSGTVQCCAVSIRSNNWCVPDFWRLTNKTIKNK